jgi:hypothetical protein
MPVITTFDRPATVPVKWYTTRRQVVSGLTNAHATARQIVDDTVQALAAVYCGKASVQCGPVVFGDVHLGELPERGFYADGRRLSLPHFSAGSV